VNIFFKKWLLFLTFCVLILEQFNNSTWLTLPKAPTLPKTLLEAGGHQKYVIAAPAIHILLPSLEAVGRQKYVQMELLLAPRRPGHPYSPTAGDRRPPEVRPNGALISAVLDTYILPLLEARGRRWRLDTTQKELHSSPW
jgi:hypothetical protein